MTRSMALLVGARTLLSILAIALAVADRLPWWFAALVVVRDLGAAALLVARRRSGVERLQAVPVMVTSASLLGAGMILVGAATGEGAVGSLGRVFGWALCWWGVGLSWAVVVERAPDVRHLVVRRDGAR